MASHYYLAMSPLEGLVYISRVEATGHVCRLLFSILLHAVDGLRFDVKYGQLFCLVIVTIYIAFCFCLTF